MPHIIPMKTLSKCIQNFVLFINWQIGGVSNNLLALEKNPTMIKLSWIHKQTLGKEKTESDIDTINTFALDICDEEIYYSWIPLDHD